MARRSQPSKRQIPADSKYNNVVVTQLIVKIMKDGKKGIAEKIVYGALSNVEEKDGQPPMAILSQAVRNATPQLQVKSRRIGGATYQVPVEIRPERSLALALRWLVAAARARQGHSMIDKLSGELSDAAKGQGSAVKRREDTHRMAEANRAFAHYRW